MASSSSNTQRNESSPSSQVKENPSSSALTSTVIVDGVLYRFKLRSPESILSGSLAPKSSHYVDLSAYPPGTDIEHEKHWDGHRVVSKVPRWAHEKWLLKFQNPDTPPNETSTNATTSASGGDRPCEDHPNSASATAAVSSGTNALKHSGEDLVQNHPLAIAAAYGSKDLKNLVENPSATAAVAYGGDRPCEDHPNSASATAAASGLKDLKDLVGNPSATAAAAAYGGKRPCEDHPNSTPAPAPAPASGAKAEAEVEYEYPYSYPYAYPAPNASEYKDFAGKYVFVIEEGGRVVQKVDEYASPYIMIGGTPSFKMKTGVFYPKQRVITVTKCKRR